jgi:hypothetical protein
VRSGVPPDLAFQLDDITRTAWCIALTEIESGEKYDWVNMEFPKKA